MHYSTRAGPKAMDSNKVTQVQFILRLMNIRVTGGIKKGI